MYLRWRRQVPQWLRIVPVELPGRGTRMAEPFAPHFDQLVDRLCAEHAGEMQAPFALFGHSMGALLAYGMARRLHDEGRPLPLALFVSASPAPAMRDPERFAGKDADDALIADLRRQGGTPEEVFADGELLRMTLDVLGADYRVCGSFRHGGGGPLPLPVHAFAGRQDDIAPPRVEAWSQEAGGVFTLDWFEGGHFFLRNDEQAFVRALIRRAEPYAPVRSQAVSAFAA